MATAFRILLIARLIEEEISARLDGEAARRDELDAALREFAHARRRRSARARLEAEYQLTTARGR